MRMLKSKWRFNKAGQGAFYTGRIGLPNGANFSFAYDCGTKSKEASLVGEIEKFQSQLSFHCNGVMHLFVVSHLDNDHVSHIKNLLQGVKTCKRAVLPYLTKLERLYLVLSQGDEVSAEGEYINFMQNYATYLLENGVEEVILVQGNENEDAGNELPGDDIPGPDNDEPVQVYSGLRVRASLTPEQEEMRKGGNISICQDNGKIYVNGLWDFYFYNKPQASPLLAAFEKYICDTYDITVDGTGLNDEQFRKIFEGEIKISRTKKEFEKLFKDVNSTGLVVLHGPLNQFHNELRAKHVKKHSRRYRYRFFRPRRMYHDYPIYCLLNGDATISNMFYPRYIEEKIPFVKIFQAPHHGSDKSWDEDCLDNLYDSFMVINFGWGNSHGHPGPELMTDLKFNQHRWFRRFVTQQKAFSYKMYTQYK